MELTVFGPDWVFESETLDYKPRSVVENLGDLHGVKKVGVEQDTDRIRVVAYDDYNILSKIQTMCAWASADFQIKRAKRASDGGMRVDFTLE
jgi:hypothetical protein